MNALFGLAIAALLWWLLKSFSRAKPPQVARLLKMAGGFVALLVAIVLVFRGRIDMAALAGGAGAWLLGWGAPPHWFNAAWMPAFLRQKRPSAASAIRSSMIEMKLEPRTGAVSGRVLLGSLAGRSLETLAPAELIRLREECLAGDLEGLRLVEAYLDRRLPGWREDAEGGADDRSRPDFQGGAMTEQEAHEVLGLQPGAGPHEVGAAHRRLMKALHPDQGGSTYLASRVNQAKDILLNRHR